MGTLFGQLFGGGAQRKLESAPDDFGKWLGDRMGTSGGSDKGLEEDQAKIEAARIKAEKERERAEALDAENAARQNKMLDMLMARARGEGPSAAQDTLQLSYDKAARGAQSTARGSRGNPALAMRQAQMQQGQLSSERGLQSGILAAQEQLQAGAELNRAIAAARQGDLAKTTGIWSNVNADQMSELEARKLAMQRQLHRDEQRMRQKMAWINLLGNAGSAYAKGAAGAAAAAKPS